VKIKMKAKKLRVGKDQRGDNLNKQSPYMGWFGKARGKGVGRNQEGASRRRGTA